MSLADILFIFFLFLILRQILMNAKQTLTNATKRLRVITHTDHICAHVNLDLSEMDRIVQVQSTVSKNLQIHVGQYSELLFKWLFVVVVYFDNVASHVLILQNRWGSWVTKIYKVIVFSKTTCFLHVRQSRALGSQQKVSDSRGLHAITWCWLMHDNCCIVVNL